MRPPARSVANALAWLAFLGLAVLALILVMLLGPLGLILLGLLTLFICSQFTLNDAAPTYGTAVFQARMARPSSPEQQAAEHAHRQAARSPLRFYRWCGILLTIAGAALAWQQFASQ